MSAAAQAPAQATGTRATVGVGAIAAAIVAIAAALQIHFGPIGDVSWLITVDEKWLAGAHPYADIIETNPPAALLLYWPGVALGKATGIAPEFWVAVVGFLTIGATLRLCAEILRRGGLAASLGPATLSGALVALTLLPGRAFNERDALAGLAMLPLVALLAARASGGETRFAHSVGAGLLAGFALALKPPYALVLVAMAPYALKRIGFSRAFGAPELGATVVGVGAMGCVVAFGFPSYIVNVLPDLMTVYAPVRESLSTLVLNAGVLIGLMIMASVAALAGPRLAAPRIAAPLLAGIGALAAYFAQGKGWLYQVEPALAFLVIAYGATLDEAAVRGRMLIATGLAALLALAAALAVGRWPMQIAVVVGIVATFGARRISAQSEAAAEGPAAMAAMIGASAIGVAVALFFQSPDGERDPILAQALRNLKPHPSVAIISEGLGLGHPLTRDVGGVWAQRTQAMLMAAAARRQIAEHPSDEALRKRMQAAIDADRDMLAEDIQRNRPDALLVGPLGTRFHAWAWADPKLTGARKDYVFYAANSNPDFPAEMWVRKDLVGLRSSDATESGK